MVKAYFPFALTLALTLGGCAQPSVKNDPHLAAQAARYGVSQTLLLQADNAGYSPRVRHGQTYFCTDQDQSFSYVPKLRCLDKLQMASWLKESASGVQSLQNRVSRGGVMPR